MFNLSNRIRFFEVLTSNYENYTNTKQHQVGHIKSMFLCV